MYRRKFVIGLAALGAPCIARPVLAQSGKSYRIGILDSGSETARAVLWKPFHARLRELGYVEGRNLQIERRFADGNTEQLTKLAGEIVAHKVDVIVTTGSGVAAAAKAAATTIPIVMTTGADPVRLGLVDSFARPGGNVTGLTSMVDDLSAKRLELIKSLLPTASKVGVIFSDQRPTGRLSVTETEMAARPLGMTVLPRGAHNVARLEAAFKELRDVRADVVIVVSNAVFFSNRQWLAELAIKHRLPTVAGGREYVEAGALVGYGPDFQDLFRRGAEYVDRILKGAKPADLPIERPLKFELVINMKTAKALGLNVPSALTSRADHLVQ